MNVLRYSPNRTENDMTMIGLPKQTSYVVEEVALPIDENGAPAIIEIAGEQYAKLPEAWPAAEDKDLEEAHAEAVANDAPFITEEQIRNIYATFTPEEVQELVEDWSRLVQENWALRKGMKTMQRKTRKQNQVQRRLERRLSQARAAREELREDAEMYKNIAAINTEAALTVSLQQLAAGETVEL